MAEESAKYKSREIMKRKRNEEKWAVSEKGGTWLIISYQHTHNESTGKIERLKKFWGNNGWNIPKLDEKH